MQVELTREELALASQLAQDIKGGKEVSFEVDRDMLLEEGREEWFFRYYFPRAIPYWEPLNDMFVGFLERERKGMAWLPGGHVKTTTLLRWFILVMCREPNISMIYTEKNEPSARKRGLAVLQELEGNERLKAHFGTFHPEGRTTPWSNAQFTIAQRRESGDSPTMGFYGAGGGSVLGQRCNILVNDDPVTPENSNSEKERSNLLQWFNEAASTSVAPLPIAYTKYLMKHFLVGTVFRLDDLYHSVKATDQFAFLHVPAVDMETGNTISPRFCYVDPKDFERAEEDPQLYAVKQKLDEGRIINLFEYRVANGSVAFNRRYQNIAIDPESQKFKEAWIMGEDGHRGCIDKTLSLGTFTDDMITVTAVDPASGSTTRHAKRFGLITLGVKKDDPSTYYLVDMDYGQYDQESDNPQRKTQVGTFVSQTLKYKSQGVIETNACQRGWMGVARREAQRRGTTIRLSPHHTGKNKLDPDIGIDGLVPMVENGQLRLPWAEANDKRKVNELISELVNYGVYPTSDLVMALWFAWLKLQKLIKGHMTPQQKLPDLPNYVNLQRDVKFPPSWNKQQREDYLRQLEGIDDEEEEAWVA